MTETVARCAFAQDPAPGWLGYATPLFNKQQKHTGRLSCLGKGVGELSDQGNVCLLNYWLLNKVGGAKPMLVKRSRASTTLLSYDRFATITNCVHQISVCGHGSSTGFMFVDGG